MKVHYQIDAGDSARGLLIATRVTPNTCGPVTMSRLIRQAASQGAGDANAYKGDPDVGLLAHINGRPC